MQDINLHQLKLEVHNNDQREEEITKKFEPFDDTDVMNEAYL